MKTCALFMTLVVLLSNPSAAKIQNGYAVDIDGMYASLKRLKSLLKDDKSLSIFQRITINESIQDLVEFIVYKEYTDRMLEQFKLICPDLYNEIDTLRDSRGRGVQVYVRFLNEKQMPAGVFGSTNLAQATDDLDAYTSEYGLHTVSVTIVAGKKCLALLAHEFGHVRFQVPNLRSYIQFYTDFYLSNNYHGQSLGHSDKDPSGKSALNYYKRFHQQQLTFAKANRGRVRSHAELLALIKSQVVRTAS